MELPPGPCYLIRMSFRALPTSLAAYTFFRFLAGYFAILSPRWFRVALSLAAYPAVDLVMTYWRRYRNYVDAAARGAVHVPQVSEGGFAVIQKILKGAQLGYIGMCASKRVVRYIDVDGGGDAYLSWRAQYGETFVIQVGLQEQRVCTCHIDCMLHP